MTQQPTISFELRRNWIFGGYCCEFSFTTELAPDIASNALDVTAHILKSQLCKDGTFQELRNIKGRDYHEGVLLPGAPAPRGEELFAVAGSIATGSDQQGFTWEPFHYSCHSHFERFEGTRTVVHSPHIHRTQSIPEWLPWWMLGAGAPIEPTFFRLGLEFFTSRFVLTRLSFTPVVTETFLIDLVGTRLSLKLKTEQPYWKPCNPFESISILSSLESNFQPLLGESLSELFKVKLQAHASF